MKWSRPTWGELTHPELKDRVEQAVTFNVAQDRWDVMDPSEDTDDHGTHVAGIISGRDVGIAPGASIYSGVMIPEGHGWTSDFILAMEWAMSMPQIGIVNMSAGIPGFYDDMLSTVQAMLGVGILPVFAIGNEGKSTFRSPGCYAEPVSVGACDRNKGVASFSGGATITYNHGNYTVPDLVAPGAGVYSCVPGGGYKSWNGTSMATPVVSGVAALLLEKYAGNITTHDLIDALLATCENLGYHYDVTRQGNGLVNFEDAARHISRISGVPWP